MDGEVTQPARSAELEALFPDVEGIAVYESNSLLQDVAPHPDEAAFISKAVEKRREEFITGRACARSALSALGMEPVPLPVGEGRQPEWPSNITGSITHTRRDGHEFIAAATAFSDRAPRRIGIGLDAEVIQPLKDGVRDMLLTPDEIAAVEDLPVDQRETAAITVFSAKEAFYKAQYAITGAWVGFGDMHVLGLAGSGTRQLAQIGDLEALREIDFPVDCRQIVRNGLVISGVTVWTRL